jgi:hypothetical protein
MVKSSKREINGPSFRVTIQYELLDICETNIYIYIYIYEDLAVGLLVAVARRNLRVMIRKLRTSTGEGGMSLRVACRFVAGS